MERTQKDIAFSNFFFGYLDCFIWSNVPDGEEWCINKLSSCSRNKLNEICFEFFNTVYRETHIAISCTHDYDYEHCGHDFALSHMNHGAGFIDRCYGDFSPLFEYLEEQARNFPYFDIDVGDDDKLYLLKQRLVSNV